MKSPRFEVFKGILRVRKKAFWWRWRLRAANGEIVAQSEGYTSRAHAIRSVMRVRTLAADADVYKQPL